VENPDGVARGIRSAQFDGRVIAERPLRLPLLDDGIIHRVQVRLG
jgi:cyclic beta-1,2-glucan synthetase